jgi:hypothetical protein
VSCKGAGSVPATVVRTSLLALVLVAFVLAGCGGKSEKDVSKAQYEQRLEKIGHDLYLAANGLGVSTNTQIFIDGVDKLQDVVNDAADTLDGVSPPGAAAQAANDRLVSAYRELGDELDKVKDARRESYPRAIAALQEAQKSAPAKETLRAAKELRQLGFKVPVFATLGSA